MTRADELALFGICIVPIIFVLILTFLSYVSEIVNKYIDKQDKKKEDEEIFVNSLYQAVTDEPLTIFDREITNELVEDMNYSVDGG